MAQVIRDWITGDPNLEEDLELMRNKAGALLARAADISTEVINEELHPGKKRKREVDNWMSNAQKLKIRVEGLEEIAGRDVSSDHRRLRDQVRKITQEMGILLQQATFHNGLTIHDLASSSLPLVTTEMKGQQFEKNLRMILYWLMTDHISKIGVYGAGGIGKTTLATHIHNQLLHKLGKSASIYWVTVSEKCTLLQLQHKIAKQLNLSANLLEEADEMKRPAILSKAFLKKSNVVVILDDMWESVPMEKVGVPVGKNQCKLLLTTRSLDVCRRMACQKSLKVEVLSKDESLSFFTEMLGNYDDLSNEAKDIAMLVAKECGGLPLGIKVVATSMRGVFDVFEWNNTLEELKIPTRIHKEMEDEVFRSLLVSYSRLNDVKLQNCFLSCALYPEDYHFKRDELVDLWMLEGHFEEIPSRREKLNKAHTMLNRLIGACLLDTKTNWMGRDVVKMHDLIRDMAIQISRQSHHTMIKVGMQLEEVPRLEEWTKELAKVSLVRNNIRGIPSGMELKCPKLSSMLLNFNPLESIPESLFQSLTGLKFLDLSNTWITMVPLSVSYLTNLSALRLSYCHSLTYVPSFEKLTKLRHLDLSFCHKVRVLPEGMDKLVNLESLLLGGCGSLCVPFRELTAGLSNIQCLELPYGVKDAKVTDILNLRYLERVMNCQVQDTSNFNRYVQSQKFHQLTSYQLHVGSGNDSTVRQCEYDRGVTICSIAFEGGAERAQLPQNIQELDAFALSDGWESLIKLEIKRCGGIEYVWAESSCSKPTALEHLEVLIIDTSSFIGLQEGRIPPGAFRNLKRVSVFRCPNVEKLFTPCMLNGQLGNLKDLDIGDCESLVEIFAGSELDEDANIDLPNLRLLSLNKLPSLVSICKSGLQLCCKSIETIKVVECPELRKLPLFYQLSSSSPPPCLKWINVERHWWKSLVWDDPRMKRTLQPFLSFKKKTGICSDVDSDDGVDSDVDVDSSWFESLGRIDPRVDVDSVDDVDLNVDTMAFIQKVILGLD